MNNEIGAGTLWLNLSYRLSGGIRDQSHSNAWCEWALTSSQRDACFILLKGIKVRVILGSFYEWKHVLTPCIYEINKDHNPEVDLNFIWNLRNEVFLRINLIYFRNSGSTGNIKISYRYEFTCLDKNKSVINLLIRNLHTLK